MFVANNTISNIKMVKVAIGGVFQPRQGERDKNVPPEKNMFNQLITENGITTRIEEFHNVHLAI
ncbi:MAG: hypothetical protein XU11_C0008G0005 [Candidatus Dadabacteria bacterium CSP1-2]|nr:MAG: hypothetical protein XU11_C0008G0005 [Candidatus Dadabacteria bacterium CSP1-2]